jgi:hypothetical protein
MGTLALGKVSLNSEPFCIRVQLTGYRATSSTVGCRECHRSTVGTHVAETGTLANGRLDSCTIASASVWSTVG